MQNSYFDFLKYSLGSASFEAGHFAALDWNGLYDFAKRHSLTAVLFQGIERIAKSVDIPRETYLDWLGESVFIKQRNRILNRESVSLCSRLVGDGFKCCILKGQGVAMLYPDPFTRMGGDIDVWIIPKDVRNARKSILDYLERDGLKVGLCYLHASVPEKNSVSVEYHFNPSFSYAPGANRRLQKYFIDKADIREAAIPEGVGTIFVPSNEFNLVFMLQHIYRHLFAEGIGLRQIVDYYYLLMKEQQAPDTLEATLKNLGLLRFSKGLMWVLQEVCALPTEKMIVAQDESEGRFLLDEILASGNFGNSDLRFGSTPKSRLARGLRKIRRGYHMIAHYPNEVLWQLPFVVWETFAIKIAHK